MKLHPYILKIGGFALGIVPVCIFLFFVTSPVNAVSGTVIAVVSSLVYLRIMHYSDIRVMTHAKQVIPESVQSIEVVRVQLEKMTMELVDIMGKILKKTTEGSDEANAVVEYFIGMSSEGKSSFGDSYISQMIKKNEEVLTKSDILFREIAKVNRELLEKVELTANKIAEIDEFVSEINKIAIQTRILALNAMIEAARAGEFAAGFSVVAEEVKRMADRSDQMAANISKVAGDSRNLMEGLRKEMQVKISDGISGMESVEKDLIYTFSILKTGIDNISEAIEVVTLNYQDIARDIKGVIVSLQYQDITSQKLDIITSDLSSLMSETVRRRSAEAMQFDKNIQQAEVRKKQNEDRKGQKLEETIKDDVTFF